MVVQIEIPGSVLGTPSYSKQDLMLDLAIALYQRKLYSLTKAARFAGMNRIQFQHVLAEKHIAIEYDLKIDLQMI